MWISRQDLEERAEPKEDPRDKADLSPFRRNSRPRAYRATSLNREWYDAVFDKVLSITGEEGRGNSPLERFFADEGLPASQAVCFACTDAGSKAQCFLTCIFPRSITIETMVRSCYRAWMAYLITCNKNLPGLWCCGCRSCPRPRPRQSLAPGG